MTLEVKPLHKNPKYLLECCDLINSEWTRSRTARLRSLESSCDHLPVSLILLQNNVLVGHLKLSKIPTIPNSCFVESVVIDFKLRGQKLGSHLMKEAELYSKNTLHLNRVYLSTKGQEVFYQKLGYIECGPINIYGGSIITVNYNKSKSINSGPTPPPLPKKTSDILKKTYMYKDL